MTLDSISTLAKSSHLSEKRSRLDTKEGARSFCQKAPLGGKGEGVSSPTDELKGQEQPATEEAEGVGSVLRPQPLTSFTTPAVLVHSLVEERSKMS